MKYIIVTVSCSIDDLTIFSSLSGISTLHVALPLKILTYALNSDDDCVLNFFLKYPSADFLNLPEGARSLPLPPDPARPDPAPMRIFLLSDGMMIGMGLLVVLTAGFV